MFVGAHEMFHFLRHSRQVAGRNGENEADQLRLANSVTFDGCLTHRRNDGVGVARLLHLPRCHQNAVSRATRRDKFRNRLHVHWSGRSCNSCRLTRHWQSLRNFGRGKEVR